MSFEELLTSDNMTYVYWACALFGTLLFFILAGLTFLFAGTGAPDIDTDVGTDVSTDSAGPGHDSGIFAFKVFSLNSILCFFMFFGWGGVLFGKTTLGFCGAVVLGVAALFISALLIHWVLKLQDPGCSSPKHYIGASGTVYLTIPANEKASGLVSLNTEDGVRQITAFSQEELPTGTPVKVIAHLDGMRFKVEKLHSNT